MATCNFCKVRNLRWVDLNNSLNIPRPPALPNTVELAEQAPRWQIQNPDGSRHSCVVARVFYRARAMGAPMGPIFMDAVNRWLAAHPEGATSFEVIFPSLYTDSSRIISDDELIRIVYQENTITATPNPAATAPARAIPAAMAPLLPLPTPTVISRTSITAPTNRLNWRGLWAEGVRYERNDVVLYASHLYIATILNTSTRPGNGSWTNLTQAQQEQLFRSMTVEPTERVEKTQQTKRAIKI